MTPPPPNGRLLLGLKGQISELELHTLRLRLTAGLINKAERGELALTLPVGLVRDARGVVQKDPNIEVQQRIALIFATFLTVRSASQVVRTFRTQGLTIPRRNRFGDVLWREPSIAAILSILKNPAYAGAFVYGRTRTVRIGPGPEQASQKVLPLEQWRIRVNDQYPAYISWETYERIRAMLQDNYAEYDRNKTRGTPRPGKALLHGLTYCGECGHKMVVQYKGSPRYICNYLRQQYRVPVCQYLPTDPIDARVVEAFFAALSPLEVDLYARAMASCRQADEATRRAQASQGERLHYQAALAERQFMQVDPDHRLVAAELERRWETALRALRQAEDTYAQAPSPPAAPELPEELKAALTDLGQHLPALWESPTLTQARKKALLRCLIDKIVLHRSARDTVAVRIVWKGGDTTTLAIPIPVGSLAEHSKAQALESRILALCDEGASDTAIAAALSAEGFRSPLHDRVLVSTVQGIRLRHRRLREQRQSHPREVAGYLTVPQLAQRLAISKHWIYDRIHNGTIVITCDPVTGLYLFPDAPATLDQFRQLRAGVLHQLRY